MRGTGLFAAEDEFVHKVVLQAKKFDELDLKRAVHGLVGAVTLFLLSEMFEYVALHLFCLLL